MTDIVPERAAELEPKLLKALGEALVVAFAIATIVDPYLKRRFAVELGSDLFWALFSSDSPADFRSAVKQLASLKLYHRSNSWTLTFDWLPDTKSVLKVEMCVEANGVNLDEKEYTPETTFWLLPSIPPYSSENNAWRFVVPDTDIREELNQEQIENLEKDTKTLSQAINDIRVPQNKGFLLERRATIYQSSGTIPLVHRFTSLRQEYHFRGNAISDLKLNVRHTGASPEQKNLPTQTSLGQIDMTFNEITFPGQVTIVSWELKSGRASGNGQAPQSQSVRMDAT